MSRSFVKLPSAAQPRVIVPTHISIRADSLFLLHTLASIFHDGLRFYFLYSFGGKPLNRSLFTPRDLNNSKVNCQLANGVHDEDISASTPDSFMMCDQRLLPQGFPLQSQARSEPQRQHLPEAGGRGSSQQKSLVPGLQRRPS